MRAPGSTQGQQSELEHLIGEYLVNPIISFFDDIFESVRKKDDKLISFQRVLKEIPKWSEINVDTCMQFLRSKCSFLNEMITALFLQNIKSMSILKNQQDVSMTVRIPKRAMFIHGVMISIAKEFYENPFIFRRNDRFAKEVIVLKALQVHAIKALPVKDILTAYLNLTDSYENPHPRENDSGHGQDGAHDELVINSQRSNQSQVPLGIQSVGGIPDLIQQMQSEANNYGLINSNAQQGDPKATDASKPELNTTPFGDENGSDVHEQKSNEATTINTEGDSKSIQATSALPEEQRVEQEKQTEEKVIIPSTADSVASSSPSMEADIFPDVNKAETAPNNGPEHLDNRQVSQNDDIHPKTSLSMSTKSGTRNKRQRSNSQTKRTKLNQPAVRQDIISVESKPVRVSFMTKKQQNALLDEILNQTRTKEMLSTTLFSDAASKDE